MATVEIVGTARKQLVDDDSERLVLAHLIENPNLLGSESVQMLRPEHFALSSHALIFRRITDLRRSAVSVDLVTLSETLKDHRELEKVGGFAALVDLGYGVVIRPNVDFNIRKLQDLALRRRLLKDIELVADRTCDRSMPLSNIIGRLGNLSAQYRDEVRAETKLQFRKAAELIESEPESVEWVVYSYVAVGAITELVGKAKLAGKTTFVTHLVKAVVEGQSFLGHLAMKSGVVYLTEQSARTFRIAMQRAGIDAQGDLAVLTHKETRGWRWSDVVLAAGDECKSSGARLLIVDTVGPFAGLAGDAENNAGDALAAMEPLQRVAGEGLAVLIVRHERKSGGQVGESGRGSSAFVGAVDIAMTLRRPEGNGRPTLREIHAVSRFEETPDHLTIELTGTGYVALGSCQQVEVQEARRTLLAMLPTNEPDAMTLDQLLSTAKISRSTAQRAVELLEKEGKIRTVGKGVRNNPHRFLCARDIHSVQTSHIKGQNAFVESKKVLETPEVSGS